MRFTHTDLRAFIAFAEQHGDQKVHENDLRVPQRRRAERLTAHGVLSKSRSTDPDREPGVMYFFDRLLVPRAKLERVERLIREQST